MMAIKLGRLYHVRALSHIIWVLFSYDSPAMQQHDDILLFSSDHIPRFSSKIYDTARTCFLVVFGRSITKLAADETKKFFNN